MSVFVVVYEFLNNSLINSDNQRERIAYHHHSVGLISRKKNWGFWNLLLLLVCQIDLDWYTLISFPSINHAWVDFIICNKLKIYYCRHHVLLSNTTCKPVFPTLLIFRSQWVATFWKGLVNTVGNTVSKSEMKRSKWFFFIKGELPATTAHWSTENSNRHINSVGTFKKFQRTCTKTLIDFHQIMIGFFQSPQFPIDVLGFQHNFTKKCRYLKLHRKCTQICTFWLWQVNYVKYLWN